MKEPPAVSKKVLEQIRYCLHSSLNVSARSLSPDYYCRGTAHLCRLYTTVCKKWEQFPTSFDT